MSAMPTVPCAHVITGQPPLGALPFGIATVPETATGAPATDSERYSSSRLLAALERTALPVSLRSQIGVPCAPAGRVAGGV
jgi:hypothetical protein